MAEGSDWKQAIVWLACIHQQIRQWDSERLWDPRLPNVAATPSEVADAERRLGNAVDGQYRQFLLHANGWENFFQEVDLFGLGDLLGGARLTAARQALEDLIEVGVPSAVVYGQRALLPIALSREDAHLFVLVRPGELGAGRVIWYRGREIDVFPDFESFFVTMAEYSRQDVEDLIRESRPGS